MAESDPLVGRTLAERFEILERIGEGGTGVVYKARQISVDRVIAIKVLGAHVSTDPSWVKRFENEARAASKLDHPNTVRLFDFGQTREGLLFIAMEYLHGTSLRKEIDTRGKLPPNRVLRIVSQICASLTEAHSLGIIHRDIKPDNVHLVEMKGAGDFVKVLDFSVAKMESKDAQVTRAGLVFGTPQYMSPEQGKGDPLDLRSDLYAVGIVAYEMLAGKPPFDAQIPTQVVLMHLQQQPPPLTGVPAPLARLVMKALEKDRAKRQQSAEELDQECQACLAELYPHHTPAAVRAVSPSQPQQVPSVAAPPPAAVTAAPPVGSGFAGGGPPPPASFVGGGPPPPASYPPPSGAPITEQKTMMAMEAPQILKPPPAAPPITEQKTVMAMAAPVLPPRGAAPPISEQKTMALEAPQLPQLGVGTQQLPTSQGVEAYARDRAIEAREALPAAAPPPPAGALFWAAWVVLGIAAGLGVHFALLAR